MILRVTTPVPGHTGSVGGVHFANGEAFVDDERFAAEVGYFRSQGYNVEDPQAAEPQAEEPAVDADPGDTKPARSASTQVWRAFAVERGGMSEAEAEALSRDQLVELYTKESDS